MRVGQHKDGDEKKVRVVLDLTKTMEYTVTPSGNTVIIAMNATAAPAAAAETPVQEKAAGAPAAAAPAAEKEVAAVEPAAPKQTAEPAAIQAPVRDEALVVGASKFSGKKISLDLQDADLITVMRLFAEVANLNIILAPDVKGKVTVRMVRIPWDQAMDIILRMNGLGYVLEDNILRIASTAELTKAI